jgi:hypothetical protein
LSYNNTTGGFTISQAGVSGNGYLSSTDWNTFNNKQASGSYITALSGEATASGPGSAAVTLSTSAVTGKLLTGVNITGGSITATDSILVAFGKIQNQINGVLGGAIYQSVWNASTNSPTLTSGTGTKGYYYIVSVAGSTNLDGITDWKVGDWAIFNGATWDKVDNTDAVSSVNGFTGAVSLTTANISESGSLYYTEGRVSANTDVAANTAARHAAVTIGTANGLSLSTQALSLALASTSATGALSSTDWNTFNLKQAALSGTGFVKISGSTISYDNSTYYLASNPTAYISLLALSSSATGLTYTNTTGVFSFTTGYSIPTNASQTQWDTAYSNRISTLNGLTAATQNFSTGMSGTDFNISSTTATHTFNIPSASATARGLLSNTDWTTFNNKQSALTNPVTGTGTSGQIAYFNGTTSITSESNLFWDATNDRLGIGTNIPSQLLHLETTLAGSTGVGTAIQITSGGAGGDQAWIGVNKGTGNGLEISVENRDIIFNTGATTPFGGTERMRITSAGVMRLNSQATYASLTYEQTIQYATSVAGIWFGNSFNNNNNVALQLRTSNDGTSVQALTLSSTGAATFSSSISTTSTIGSGQGVENAYLGNGYLGFYNAASSAKYIKLADDGSEINAIRFSKSSSIATVSFPSGPVGIGTDNPNQLLHIEGNDSGSIQFKIKNNNLTNGNKYLALFVGGTTGYGISGWANSSVFESAAGTGSNLVIGNYEDGPIIFQTNNRVERVRIYSSGAILCTSSVTATGFFESSDSRLKTLIQDNYQTKGIASITPKLYTKNGKVELGYYAQDFVGILDSAVSKGEDEMLSLSYREVLVAKVYALEQEIKELKAKMN